MIEQESFTECSEATSFEIGSLSDTNVEESPESSNSSEDSLQQTQESLESSNSSASDYSDSKEMSESEKIHKLKIFTEYSGREFNELVGKKKFYRFNNPTEEHRGVKYKTGVNKDPLQFNPSGTCERGGLYFISEDELAIWLEKWLYHFCLLKDRQRVKLSCKCNRSYFSPYIFKWIREVKIRDQARVYVDNKKYKANEFVLGERIDIHDFKIDSIEDKILNKYPHLLKFIKNQTHKQCIEAIRKCPMIIKDVNKQTDELCKMALAENLDTFKYIKHPTPLIKKFVKNEKRKTKK